MTELLEKGGNLPTRLHSQQRLGGRDLCMQSTDSSWIDSFSTTVLGCEGMDPVRRIPWQGLGFMWFIGFMGLIGFIGFIGFVGFVGF